MLPPQIIVYQTEVIINHSLQKLASSQVSQTFDMAKESEWPWLELWLEGCAFSPGSWGLVTGWPLLLLPFLSYIKAFEWQPDHQYNMAIMSITTSYQPQVPQLAMSVKMLITHNGAAFWMTKLLKMFLKIKAYIQSHRSSFPCFYLLAFSAVKEVFLLLYVKNHWNQMT